MTCPSCADHGVFKVCYFEDNGADPDFALCLCPAGERMRKATNNGKPCTPQWQVWAHRNNVPLERVAPMEDLLDAGEMAERGFAEAPAPALDAIAAAARSRGLRR